MGNIKTKMLSLLLICVFLLTFITGCGGQSSSGSGQDDEIKIGFLGALTGEVASYGINTLKGMKMAADEINADGGVLGKKIRIIEADNRGDKGEIANVTQKFITRDKVAAIIGDPTTGGTKVAAQIAQQGKVVLLSAGAVGTGVVEIGDYIFRNTLLDSVAAPVVVKYLKENMGWEKVAIVTSKNNDYSVGQTKVFKKALSENGVEVVTEEFIQDKDTNFSGQVTNIKAKNPDGIVFTGYYTEGGLLMAEAYKQGLKVNLVGGDGLLSDVLIKLGGKGVEGSMTFAGFSPEKPDENTKKFIDTYKTKYNEEPDMFVAQGYDAVKIIAEAIKKANSTDPTVFKAELAKIKDFPGVSGSTTFKANREPVKSPVNLLVVKNGKFSLLAKIPVEIN
ncbi:ABC transporter substrate-binding protein [Bacillota bacterium LX-D]|nr:ABC transporter substrate-binding protein [Bacillota bacterium LX-D]